MVMLNWEYKGVDVIQLVRNKTMPKVIKVKNMDGVVRRYIPERTCHVDTPEGWYVGEGYCSNCRAYLDGTENYCWECGAKVVE